METKAVWKGKMRFDGLSSNGFTVPMDSSVESGGENGGVRPIEMLLVGLVGCTAMDVISILNKMRQDVTDFEVRVIDFKRAADHPRVYTYIKLEYAVTGRNIDRESVERAVELSSGRYCSAQGMLGKVAQIEYQITVTEAVAA